MEPIFGPSGNSDSFYEAGFKHSWQAPGWLAGLGLTAFEYSCGKGVNISLESAEKIGREAAKYRIAVSLHAPYYISLPRPEQEKRDRSIQYVLDSAAVLRAMGGTHIVLHCGSEGKIGREAAMELAADTLRRAQQALDENGFEEMVLCPETMGKVKELGTVEETLKLCQVDERFLPTLDFGHINARTQGGLKTYEDFKAVFDAVENALGRERASQFHSHFSKIEYGDKGEKKHLTFQDQEFGPEFDYVAVLAAERGYAPTFICESNGTMAEDALTMKALYETAIRELK